MKYFPNDRQFCRKTRNLSRLGLISDTRICLTLKNLPIWIHYATQCQNFLAYTPNQHKINQYPSPRLITLCTQSYIYSYDQRSFLYLSSPFHKSIYNHVPLQLNKLKNRKIQWKLICHTKCSFLTEPEVFLFSVMDYSRTFVCVPYMGSGNEIAMFIHVIKSAHFVQPVPCY